VRLTLAAAAALCACVHVAVGADTAIAQLFDRGIPFAQFVVHVQAQRETWLKNAAGSGVAADAVRRLARVRDGLRVLIVAEDWCVDSAHTVPYIAKTAAAAGIEVRIVDRIVGERAMLAHRSRDGRLVTPVVVLLRNGRDVGAWVEHPALLARWFSAMAVDPAAARRFADRAAWYEDDRGQTTIAEFVARAEQTR
jgi:hypothetical protein